MNRKGQALVEFVLILPILILMLFMIFDFGNIFYSKYELQNQSSDIIRLIVDGGTIEEIESIYLKYNIEEYTYKENYKKITISREIELITPILDRVLGNSYQVSVERIMPNDET